MLVLKNALYNLACAKGRALFLGAIVLVIASFATVALSISIGASNTAMATNLTSYQGSLVPLQDTAKFANTLLWIILGVGTAILILLHVCPIRAQRKYEIGVLIAIGMKKSAVALQFVTALLLVCLFAFLAGAGIGALASVPIANALAHVSQAINFGHAGMNFAIFAQLMGIGVALALLGSLVTVIDVLRYKPLKILNEKG